MSGVRRASEQHGREQRRSLPSDADESAQDSDVFQSAECRPPALVERTFVYRCKVYLDKVYSAVAIQGFVRKEVEAFFLSGRAPRGEGWASARAIAKRKLDMLDYAAVLSDLASPPGNRLEALKGDLKGDLKGLHSVRINDQWRIIFRWTTDGPDDVDIRDYH